MVSQCNDSPSPFNVSPRWTLSGAALSQATGRTVPDCVESSCPQKWCKDNILNIIWCIILLIQFPTLCDLLYKIPSMIMPTIQYKTVYLGYNIPLHSEATRPKFGGPRSWISKRMRKVIDLDMTQCAMSPLAGLSGYRSSIRAAMQEVLYIVSIRHLHKGEKIPWHLLWSHVFYRSIPPGFLI